MKNLNERYWIQYEKNPSPQVLLGKGNQFLSPPSQFLSSDTLYCLINIHTCVNTIYIYIHRHTHTHTHTHPYTLLFFFSFRKVVQRQDDDFTFPSLQLNMHPGHSSVIWNTGAPRRARCIASCSGRAELLQDTSWDLPNRDWSKSSFCSCQSDLTLCT